MNVRDVELVVTAGEAEAAERVGAMLAEAARAGAEIALTGGSTPGKAYERAAELEPDWSRAGVWWGDERCVPPDDSNSNYGLAKKTLLDRLAVQPGRIHRIHGEDEPERAAEAYERELQGQTLDLVLLGLGPDGHVASLFPGSPGLEERNRLAVAAEPGLEPFVPRVTLTPGPLRSGRTVVFLVTGDSKADAVAKALGGPPTVDVPGSLIRSDAGRTIAVVDEAAAAGLRD